MVLQYWTSISFAVLVASHLTKGQVNGWVVAIALIFYAAFSWLMSTMIVFDGEIVSGGLAGPMSLFLAALIVPGFIIDGFWTALFGAIIVSLTGMLASWFIGPKGRVEILVVRR